MVRHVPEPGTVGGGVHYAASSVMMWDAKSGSAPLRREPGDGEVAVVLGAVPMLDEVDEAALGEVVGAAAEQRQRGARRRVAQAAEGGAVEREIAAVVLEDRAGLGLRDPGAELDLADAGSGNPDDRRFRHGGAPRLRCGKSMAGPAAGIATLHRDGASSSRSATFG